MLEFVDNHGNEVLDLGSFTLLPEHVVRLILAREELQADEFSKFQVRILCFKVTYNLSLIRQHSCGVKSTQTQPRSP